MPPTTADLMAMLQRLEWSGTRQGPGYGYMSSGNDGRRYPACPICKAAAAGTCTGQSLSEPVATHAYVTYDGPVPDIPQYRTGTLNVHDTVVASAEAYKAAVKAELAAAKAEHRLPSIPDPRDSYTEVVDWNAPSTGSCP